MSCVAKGKNNEIYLSAEDLKDKTINHLVEQVHFLQKRLDKVDETMEKQLIVYYLLNMKIFK